MNTAGTPTRSTRALGTGAAIALAGAIAVSALATFGGEQKDDQTSTFWVVALFLVAITALVFGLVVRPAVKAEGATNRAALAGLVTSIAGIVTIVAFWSGLPVLLGTAGALMGLHGKERAEQGLGRRGMALTAIVLGILAAAGAAVIVVMEMAGI
jgi:heme/copper-type cytochrome/quinol oxidase subunit 2